MESTRTDVGARERRWFARHWLELMLALLASTTWPHFLGLGTAVLTCLSACRIYRAWRFLGTATEAPSRLSARRVIWLSSTAGALSTTVAGVAVAALNDVNDGVSASTFVVCGVALVVRTCLEISAAQQSRDAGIPPPLSRNANANVESTADSVAGPRESWFRFGPSGPGEAPRFVALTSSVVLGALLVSTAAGPLAAPHRKAASLIRRFTPFGDRGGEEESSPGAPRASGSGAVDPASSASGGMQASPSVSPSPVTADEYCGYKPEEVLKAGVPSRVADAPSAAYAPEGAQEIGCPGEGVQRRASLFRAELSGGESNPSWLVSDRKGHAAVIFDHMVPVAKRLWRNEAFARAFPRQSRGAGEYQLFGKADGSCILAIRNTYQHGYVVLPSPVTHTVMHLSFLVGAFPSVEDLDASPGLVARGRVRVSWPTSGGTEAVTMTKKNAPQFLRGTPAGIVGQKCPEVTVLDALAAEARALSEAEAATTSRGEPSAG